MRASPYVLLSITLLLAGCAAPDTPSITEDPMSLQGPHALSVGDWWRIDVLDVLTQDAFSTTLVVTNVTPDGYLVGMSENEFHPELLLLPGAGSGPVGRDLSWSFMREEFHPIAFPIVEGATWKTRMQGGDLDGEVIAVEGGIATIELHGPRNDIYIKYDAARGILSSVDNDGWVKANVTQTGHGYSGRVIVPWAYDHAIVSGLAMGVISPHGGAPAPQETIRIDERWTHLTVTSTAGPITGPSPAAVPLAGTFREKATAPSGEIFEIVVLPGEAMRVETRSFEAPSGDWVFEHVAGGGGAAFSFGVAYELLQVDLG